MKVKVDASLCIGCELCVDVCPEAFRMGDDDFAHPTRDVFNEEHYDCIRDASDSCPVTAISMTEE